MYFNVEKLSSVITTPKSLVTETERHLISLLADTAGRLSMLTSHLQQNFPQIMSNLGDGFYQVDPTSMRVMSYFNDEGPRMQLRKEVTQMHRDLFQQMPTLNGLKRHEEPVTRTVEYRVKDLIEQRLTARSPKFRWLNDDRTVISARLGLDKLPTLDLSKVYSGGENIKTGLVKYNYSYGSTVEALCISVDGVTVRTRFDVRNEVNTGVLLYFPSTHQYATYVFHPIEEVWLRDQSNQYLDFEKVYNEAQRYFDSLELPVVGVFNTVDELSARFLEIIERHTRFDRLVELAKEQSTLPEQEQLWSAEKRWSTDGDSTCVRWRIGPAKGLPLITFYRDAESNALKFLEFADPNGRQFIHDAVRMSNDVIATISFAARQLLLDRFEQAIITLTKDEPRDSEHDSIQRTDTDEPRASSAAGDVQLDAGEPSDA